MIAALVGAPLGNAAQAAVLAYSSFLNLPDEKEAGALEHNELIVRRRLPPTACSQLIQVCILGVQLASRHSAPLPSSSPQKCCNATTCLTCARRCSSGPAGPRGWCGQHDGRQQAWVFCYACLMLVRACMFRSRGVLAVRYLLACSMDLPDGWP